MWEDGGVSPRCHICSLQWLLQTAGSVQRLQVHASGCLGVTGWLWDYKVSLGPKVSPGRSRLLIPSLCNERPWGDHLAHPLCTGSVQDELALSLITILIVTRPPKSFQMEGEHVATWCVCSAPSARGSPSLCSWLQICWCKERAGNQSRWAQAGTFSLCSSAPVCVLPKNRALSASGGVAGSERR